jgi:Tfp pilus assembly protein PilF
MWRAAHDEISRVTQERPGDEAARELQALIEQAMVPPVAQPTSVAGPETVSNSQEVVGSSATEYFQRRDAKAAENARFAEGKMDEVEALRVQGKIEQAREILDGIRKVPDLTETQRERFTCMEAEFYALDGDIATADEMYSRVVSLNPRCVRGLCGKGALAAERQEWETAQEYFEKALAIDPTYDVALAGLGLCAMVNRKEEKAFELFMQAVASNPENRRALLGVLQLGYPMKKYAEIEKAINSYLDRHPANIEMLYSFAGILFAQGKVEQAKTEVEKILIFEPKHTNALELRDLIRGDKPASLVGA